MNFSFCISLDVRSPCPTEEKAKEPPPDERRPPPDSPPPDGNRPALVSPLPAVASAASPETGEEQVSEGERLDEVESKLDVLAQEIGRIATSQAVPEEPELESSYGLGPAASKVYRKDHGLSIGGYGEFRYRAHVTDENDGLGGTKSVDDVSDALRAVLYTGYKFSDKVVMNSEIEFEHAGGSDVWLEFLTLDYFLREDVALRGGLLLIPMGFVNEIHEPTFYFGAERPEVELRIIPSTWRENGAGLFGQVADRLSYRFYAVNGFKASGFAVDGLRGGRQKGAKAISNDWAFVGRIDLDVASGLLVGSSVYAGNSGQEQTGAGGDLPDALTVLWEMHAEYKAHGASFRGLFVQAFVDDARELNAALAKSATASVAEQMVGGYVEAGYDVLPLVFPDTKMSLEPFFRYELVDTQQVMPTGAVRNSKYVQDIYTVGVSFKPIPELVVKFDYRNIRPDSDPDDVADQVQVGLGYVF